MPRRKLNEQEKLERQTLRKENNHQKRPYKKKQVPDNDENRKSTPPKTVYNACNIIENSEKMNNNTINSDEEPVIMHLDVNCEPDKNSSKDVLEFFDNSNVNYSEENNKSTLFEDELKQDNFDNFNVFNMNYFQEDKLEDNSGDLKVVKLLREFEEKNKYKEWPMSTSIACYNCCHKFSNAPIGIPVKYSNDVFYVVGCFCSLECAMSYNLNERDQIDNMWEKNNLLNLLSKRLGNHKGYIKPAPNRLCLKFFGGHLTIDEYRDFHKSNKVTCFNFPPMQTLTQQVEEINESDIKNYKRFVPVDTDRINNYKKELKLKRTKPLHNVKNTLDHALNIRITNSNSNNEKQ